MVKPAKPLYLFLGQDDPAKDVLLARIKKEILPSSTQAFNLDTLYAHELTLRALQEKLLFLPTLGARRLIVIKQAQDAPREIKDFLGVFVRDIPQPLALVIDISQADADDPFVAALKPYAQVSYFTQHQSKNVFYLDKLIQARKTHASLEVLHELLANGEKPERIMGGLRATWLRYTGDQALLRRKIKLLLECDIDIKTGRAKPVLALEKFVVALCSFRNFSG